MIEITPLDTSVPGSFPVLPFYPVKQDFPPYTDEVPEGELYIDDPYLPGVFTSLQIQAQTEIDYPSYGQPQEMCSMFLGYLIDHGLEYRNGFHVVGDIEIPRKTPAIEYLQVAQKYFTFKGIRMPLTGPITLAATIKVGEKRGIDYPEIIEKLARFVAHIAYNYDKGGAHIISIDEPSLVYGLYVGLEPEFIGEVINTALSKIHNAVPAIHVCGSLNPNITDILLSTNAFMLDHEFAAIPQNITMYTKNDLESARKIIGYGCVETNMEPASLIEIQKDGDWSKVVEPVDVIKKRILEGINQWGRENIIVDPDCGFGGLRGYIRGNLTCDNLLKICFNKLDNMVKAKKEVV